MSSRKTLRVAVMHNRDFEPGVDRPDQSDVENAARDVARGLAEFGHEVRLVGIGGVASPRETVLEVLDLRRQPTDLVFNLCESLGGRTENEPLVPALLDLMRVPYTGSGPIALGLALRKDRAKLLLTAAGVPTPAAAVCASERDAARVRLGWPVIVKPTREDASVGIAAASVVTDRSALIERVAYVTETFRQPALVERYIEGREIYCSLIGNGTEPVALPLHEIDFSEMPADRPRIVSYEGKWDPASVDYRGTQPRRAHRVDARTRRRIAQAARGAFAALELRDYARVDMRVAADGTPYVIDINPNCDLSASAGVARAASFAGWSYAELIQTICQAAIERHLPADARPQPASARVSGATSGRGGRR